MNKFIFTLYNLQLLIYYIGNEVITKKETKFYFDCIDIFDIDI